MMVTPFIYFGCLQKDEISHLSDIFTKMNFERKEIVREVALKVNKLEYNVDFESMIASLKKPGRPHVGNLLVKAGYFKTLD